MESITTLADLSHLYRSFKVTTVYVKHLSLKQDNDKNQIYLGKIGEPLANLFPSEIITRGPSTSTKKRHSEKGESIIERKILNFFGLRTFNILTSHRA